MEKLLESASHDSIKYVVHILCAYKLGTKLLMLPRHSLSTLDLVACRW
jgi:hypothetical protein